MRTSKLLYIEYIASHDPACLHCLSLRSFLLTHCHTLYASNKLHYLVLLSLPNTPTNKTIVLVLQSSWMLHTHTLLPQMFSSALPVNSCFPSELMVTPMTGSHGPRFLFYANCHLSIQHSKLGMSVLSFFASSTCG